MKFPAILERFKLQDRVSISERRMIYTYDTSYKDFPAGGVDFISIRTDASTPSNVPLDVVGQDIILSSGQLLLIEGLQVIIASGDASTKLKLTAIGLSDGGDKVAFSMRGAGLTLPYTFSACQDDNAYFSIDPSTPEELLIDPCMCSLHGQVLAWIFYAGCTNLDGAATHSYARQLRMYYRVISGIEAGVPLQIDLSEEAHER